MAYSLGATLQIILLGMYFLAGGRAVNFQAKLFHRNDVRKKGQGIIMQTLKYKLFTAAGTCARHGQKKSQSTSLRSI